MPEGFASTLAKRKIRHVGIRIRMPLEGGIVKHMPTSQHLSWYLYAKILVIGYKEGKWCYIIDTELSRVKL